MKKSGCANDFLLDCALLLLAAYRAGNEVNTESIDGRQPVEVEGCVSRNKESLDCFDGDDRYLDDKVRALFGERNDFSTSSGVVGNPQEMNSGGGSESSRAPEVR